MGGDEGMVDRRGGAEFVWRVDTPDDELLSKAFVVGDDASIRFGWDGRAAESTSLNSLREWTLFRDYLMEGFVTYEMRVRRDGEASLLELRLTSTNRDAYVPNHIRFHLDQCGLAGLVRQIE